MFYITYLISLTKYFNFSKFGVGHRKKCPTRDDQPIFFGRILSQLFTYTDIYNVWNGFPEIREIFEIRIGTRPNFFPIWPIFHFFNISFSLIFLKFRKYLLLIIQMEEMLLFTMTFNNNIFTIKIIVLFLRIL